MLDRPVPMPVAYKYFAGARESGFPLDPRPLLPAQLFLTGRPKLWGLDDPAPEALWAFVLPGRRQCATDIDWREFDAPSAKVVESERRAHVAGAELGWRAVLDRHLGDFRSLSIALGYAARSSESADEIVSAVHAIVSAHPDLTAERADQYTAARLRQDLLRLRAKDAARDASIDARIDAIRGKFPRLGFLA